MARTFNRFLLSCLLSFQLLSLAVVVGCLYGALDRSYSQEFRRNLEARESEISFSLQERLNRAIQLVRSCSTDNSLRICLMLGMTSQLNELLHKKYAPINGMYIFVHDEKNGRISPQAPFGTPTGAILKSMNFKTLFALGPKPFLYFHRDTCFFVATSPIMRKDERLGTALVIYAIREDVPFWRRQGINTQQLLVYRHGNAMINLFTWRKVPGNFSFLNPYSELESIESAPDAPRYALIPIRNSQGLYLAGSFAPLEARRLALLKMLGLLCVVVLATTFAIALAISRKVNRPLKTLVQHAERLAQEPSSRFIQQDTMPYVEFQDLAVSFNKMLQSFLDLQKQLALTAQKKLDASEQRYRTLVETSPLGILTLDFSGTFLLANKAATSLLGYREEEIVGSRWSDLVPNEENAAFSKMVEHLEQGAKLSRELRIRHKQGRLVWVEINANITREQDRPVILLMLADISERKQIEDERQRMVTAIEQVPEAIVITDPQRRIQYANMAFEKIFGYPRHHVLGRNIRKLIGTPQTREVVEAIDSVLAQGKTWKGDLINQAQDGRIVETETSITPIVGEGGVLENIVYVKRDVTKEREFQRHLRQSQKLQAIGTLAGGIAHDFNNLLTSIWGNSQLALTFAQDENRVRHHLERINQGCQRAAEMVRQILTFSRQEDQPFENFHLRDLIEETLQLLRGILPATVEIETDLQVEDDLVNGDATQIHQVLMNLATNAVHAMKERCGTMWISLREVSIKDPQKARRLDVEAGSYLCLTVADDGVGMPPEIRERVFEPFFTTKPPGEGSGLGLSVVHGIVRNHRGAVELESEPGKGTRVSIYLPRADEESPSRVQTPAISSDTARNIMLVDDENMVREVTREFLEIAGHRVTAFPSPKEVLKFFDKESPEAFDLLIIDFTMPQMTGMELLKKLRSMGISTPALLSTGNSEAVPSEALGELKVISVLRKPYTQNTLSEAVKNAFSKGVQAS